MVFPNNFILVFGFLDDGNPSANQEYYLRLWQARYPSWNVVWIRNATWVRNTLKQIFNKSDSALSVFDSMLSIQKADIARYCALFVFGGVYRDIDTKPGPRDITNWLATKTTSPSIARSGLFFEETVLTSEQAEEVAVLNPIRRGLPEDRQRIANYFFVSAPKHPIWIEIIRVSFERVRRCPKCRGDYDVLYTTGPDVVTHCVHRWKSTNAIEIVTRPEDQLYFRHDAQGSWRRKRLF
eukprot:PhM_4_TR3677/c0_g2_i1/m.65193